MTTSEPAPTGGETGQARISSAAGSPASPCPSPASNSPKPTSGGYGRRSRTPFADYDPGSCSWRTFQGSLFAEWETYSETWPRAGMTRSGIAYRRPPSAPLTAATGSGLLPTPRAIYGEHPGMTDPSHLTGADHLWPTPTASERGRTPEEAAQRHLPGRAMGRNGGGSPDLTSAVVHRLWPTPSVNGNHNYAGASPTSGDGLDTAVKKSLGMWPTPKGSAANYGRPRDNDRGDLQAAVLAWPTPQARDHRTGQPKRVGDPARHGGWNLNDWAAMWPTPRASDGAGASSHGRTWSTTDHNLHTVMRELGETEAGGQLNPTWVEWLMGYPEGWTDCGD